MLLLTPDAQVFGIMLNIKQKQEQIILWEKVSTSNF